MTNDQCIEIAEKVWGWGNLNEKYNDDRHEHTRYLPECVEWEMNYSFGEWIKELVNSWQGFGRTVEAINYLYWSGKINVDTYNQFIDELVLAMFQVPFNVEVVCRIIHLAALEAIKNNSK